jgi:hypothetical protein
VKRTDAWRRKKVMRASEGLLRWLGLWQTYHIDVFFKTKLEPNATNNGRDIACNVAGFAPYRRIAMTFQRAYVDEYTEAEIEETVLHEVIHVALFNPLQKLGLESGLTLAEWQPLEEGAVDLATRWLSRARPPWGYHESGVPHRSDPKKVK